MAVEILENTLLKLLVRRGTDADRKLVTLGDGELGYTTDTERLFVGNSTDRGGVVVGNKYAGANSNLLSLAPAVTGDYAFETDTNELNVLTSGTGAAADNWTVVATKVTAGDTTIDIDSTNAITVGKQSASTGGGLSADNISPDALGDSIVLDGAKRISLSANVNIDGITKRSDSSNYLSLPNALKIGTFDYDWPTNDPQNRNFLGTDANNNLRWTIPSIVDSAIAPTSGAVLPVGTIVPYISSVGSRATPAAEPDPIPYGWLSCDGASVNASDYRDLSAVIGLTYGGDTADPDTATTFKLPDLTNRMLYGSYISDTAASTLYAMATGTSLAADSAPLSAAGVNYIIKSVGGVTSPTLTVGGNLSAFVNGQDKTSPDGGVGTAFDFLSGNVTIERPPPGQVVFNEGGTHAFTMPDGISHVKYYVTGSGSVGGSQASGAAATVIGYLSAGYRTRFTLTVANAPAMTRHTAGQPSMIAVSGTELITAGGGIVTDRNKPTGDADNVAYGVIATNDHILNGYVAVGASGDTDTDDSGDEEGRGAPSFWGGSPNPGAGSGTHSNYPMGAAPGNGMIMFEWT